MKYSCDRRDRPKQTIALAALYRWSQESCVTVRESEPFRHVLLRLPDVRASGTEYQNATIAAGLASLGCWG